VWTVAPEPVPRLVVVPVADDVWTVVPVPEPECAPLPAMNTTRPTPIREEPLDDVRVGLRAVVADRLSQATERWKLTPAAFGFASRISVKPLFHDRTLEAIPVRERPMAKATPEALPSVPVDPGCHDEALVAPEPRCGEVAWIVGLVRANSAMSVSPVLIPLLPKMICPVSDPSEIFQKTAAVCASIGDISHSFVQEPSGAVKVGAGPEAPLRPLGAPISKLPAVGADPNWARSMKPPVEAADWTRVAMDQVELAFSSMSLTVYSPAALKVWSPVSNTPPP
jgi:hypothetical protein